MTALEATSGQAARVEVWQALSAGDGLGCSSGCRPGRHPHDALEARPLGRGRSQVHGVLSRDMRGWFELRKAC